MQIVPAGPAPVMAAVTVRLANATHGARWPSDLVSLAGPLARELIRQGLATAGPS